MDGPPSSVWCPTMFTTLRLRSSEQSAFIFAQNKFRMNVASPLHVTEENPSRSLIYGDEGIECVTTLMSSVVTSTRYDWQSIPQYGEFFVCRLNLISATSVAWNSSGSETVYGLWPTDHRNFFPEPSLRKGAKWNPQPEHMVKYQKVQLTQSDFLIFSPMCLNIMVCLNKSLSLGLCDPRRCIRYIGYTTPVYPRYKYSAEVQLYWALHGTEGSNPECKYNAGARLFRTQRGTKGYCRGALHKCKYSVVRSSRTQPGTVGYYHLGTSPMMQCIAEGKKAIASSAGTLEYNKCKCSADMKKATTFPWLQYIAEGKKVPTFETLFCLMLQYYIAEGKKLISRRFEWITKGVRTFCTLACARVHYREFYGRVNVVVRRKDVYIRQVTIDTCSTYRDSLIPVLSRCILVESSSSWPSL
jgi:hypothetical protein